MDYIDSEDKLLDDLDVMFDNEDFWCEKCVHFHDGDIDSCDAFPRGIPQELIDGMVRHTKPYKGDHGIMFEPRPK